MKKSRQRATGSAVILVAALLCLLFSVCGGLAAAASGESDPFSAEAPLVPTSEAVLGDSPIPIGTGTDPAAAEELPHGGLDRAEAEDLLTSVFPSALEESAGIFNGLEVEEFRSDHVAVVSPEGASGPAGLLTSTLPLRTEGPEGRNEAVDLELERDEGELEPANPLVEVGIPATANDGISLPETGIEIVLSGSGTERSASTISGAAAFYPNVATDTDLSVVPTPTGVETYTQLRTPQAPQSQTFDLNLPPGAELSPSADGGASVTRSGDQLLSIQPPAAIDAEGNDVPVSLHVAGSSITLTAEPSAEASFPILLDPVYDSYSWAATGTDTGIGTDWRSATSNEALLKPGVVKIWNETMHHYLGLTSYYGAITPGSQANWNYYVPRYFSDYENPLVRERPTSFIRNMTLSQVYFQFEESSPHANPYMLVGLWAENKGEFASLGTHNATEGQYNNATIPVPNPGEYTDVKNGGMALATSESISYPRNFFVGSATVELSDKDSPEFTSLVKGPSAWVNETAASPITYSAVDKGLGLYSFLVNQGALKGGTTTVTTSAQCLGSVSSPCPREATNTGRAIAYEPKSMPQGEDWITITASDPVGHKSPVEEAPVKVDHTAPSLALSGNLTEQAKVGTKLSSYALNYAATDGDETAAAATTPIGTTGTGSGQMQRPMGIAVDGSGNVWMVDRENNRVEEFNAKGEFIRQFGSLGSGNGQLSDPRGIAISSAGNVWVSELGNKRLQEFSPTGTFIRTITNASFVEPVGIATGPEETLWVSDIGAHKVFQFKENGTLVRSISKFTNPGSVTFTTPTGIGVDRSGNAYVAEQASNQVVEVNPAGEYVQKFGATGSATGQFKAPNGIAIAASGNVFVVDAENNRVQEFKPDGTFLRQFGSTGTASNQLTEPRGIAVAPGNEVLIADAANHRLARWTHADKDPQSGVAKVQVKVDGTVAKTEAPGCSNKDCQINGSWALNADNYAPGSHKVEAIATDGVGLTTTKTLNVETHGDDSAPSIALSGTMTEQATKGTTLPTYKLKAAATDPGSAEERKSGVASETIKFDGAVVDSSAPGCPSEGCSLTREWTLESSKKEAGSHKVEVTATDAAGHTTTKTLEIKIERDTTPPSLETGSEKFFTAPSGWLEQKNYEYVTVASDPKGYGVTSLQLKIDGSVVKSASGSCSAGACEQFLWSTINLASYKGGEHKAELVATDGAGNVKTKTWMLRVDPAGAITPAEGEDTLEAVDETSPVNTVGQAVAEKKYEGTEEGLELREAGESLEAVGSLTPTSLGPEGELTLEVPPVEAYISCPTRPAEESSNELTGAQEEELAATAGCNESELLGSTEETPASLEVTPPSGTGSPALTEESAAAVTPDAATEADIVTRPLTDGGMTFTAIRGPQAPEKYAFTLDLEEGMEMKLVDPQHAVVMYPDGVHHALSITAVEAHDAIGTTVPTSLSVSGNVVTLTVPHKGGSYVYPVVAGAGWEGGFETYEIEMPKGEGEEEAAVEEERLEGTLSGYYDQLTYGSPVFASNDTDGAPIRKRAYNFHRCRWTGNYPNAPEGKPTEPLPPKERKEVSQGCHGTQGQFTIDWAVSIHGVYEYKRGEWAWVKEEPECSKWGPDQPAKVNCYATSLKKAFPHTDVIGDFRFRPGTLNGSPRAGCFEFDGVLPSYHLEVIPGEKALENNYHYSEQGAWENEKCPWGHLEIHH